MQWFTNVDGDLRLGNQQRIKFINFWRHVQLDLFMYKLMKWKTQYQGHEKASHKSTPLASRSKC